MSEEPKIVRPNTTVTNVGKVYRVTNKGTELVAENGIALKEINRGDWLMYDPSEFPEGLMGAIFSE